VHRFPSNKINISSHVVTLVFWYAKIKRCRKDSHPRSYTTRITACGARSCMACSGMTSYPGKLLDTFMPSSTSTKHQPQKTVGLNEPGGIISCSQPANRWLPHAKMQDMGFPRVRFTSPHGILSSVPAPWSSSIGLWTLIRRASLGRGLRKRTTI